MEVFIEFKPIFLQSGIDLSYLKCLGKYTELPAAGENFEDFVFLMEFKPIFWQSGIDLSYLKRLRKNSELPVAGENYEDLEVFFNQI